MKIQTRKEPSTITELLNKIKPIPRFKVYPKHWWMWLYPSFWKHKNSVENTVNHLVTEKDFMRNRDKAISDMLLYGHAYTNDNQDTK